MANGKDHQAAGTVCGAAAALVLARDQEPSALLIETIGGALGGNLGGRMPDLIDPSTAGPRHRSIAHGVLPTSSLGGAYLLHLSDWQKSLRQKANQYAAEAQQAQSDGKRMWLNFLALLCRLLSGALAGFPAGYFSHLVMDARTKMGLPLVA